jgi:hypothetical protein
MGRVRKPRIRRKTRVLLLRMARPTSQIVFCEGYYGAEMRVTVHGANLKFAEG